MLFLISSSESWIDLNSSDCESFSANVCNEINSERTCRNYRHAWQNERKARALNTHSNLEQEWRQLPYQLQAVLVSDHITSLQVTKQSWVRLTQVQQSYIVICCPWCVMACVCHLCRVRVDMCRRQVVLFNHLGGFEVTLSLNFRLRSVDADDGWCWWRGRELRRKSVAAAWFRIRCRCCTTLPQPSPRLRLAKLQLVTPKTF